MIINKIMTTLRPIKPEKMIKVLDDTIPGESFKILNKNKKQLAQFARQNGIKKVYFYDYRRLLKDDEFCPPSLEEKFGEEIAMIVKKGKNKFGLISFNFFKYPNGQYITNPQNKLIENIHTSIINFMKDKTSKFYSSETIKSFAGVDTKKVK